MTVIECGSACAGAQSCIRTACELSQGPAPRLPACAAATLPQLRDEPGNRTTPTGGPTRVVHLRVFTEVGAAPARAPQAGLPQEAHARSSAHTRRPIVFLSAVCIPARRMPVEPPDPALSQHHHHAHFRPAVAPAVRFLSPMHVPNGNVQLLSHSPVRPRLAHRLGAGACSTSPPRTSWCRGRWAHTPWPCPRTSRWGRVDPGRHQLGAVAGADALPPCTPSAARGVSP